MIYFVLAIFSFTQLFSFFPTIPSFLQAATASFLAAAACCLVLVVVVAGVVEPVVLVEPVAKTGAASNDATKVNIRVVERFMESPPFLY